MDLLFDIKETMLPEGIITITLLVIFCLSILLRRQDDRGIFFFASYAGIILAFSSMLFMDFSPENQVLSRSFVSNNITLIFRIIILLGTAITIFLAKDYVGNFGKNIGEFYFLVLTATLGALVLVGANDLITAFIGFETLSISSFALCKFNKSDKFSDEASLKYLIFGAVASAVMLYGFSFIYGISGNTNFNDISLLIDSSHNNFMLLICFIFIFVGFGFKISAVPFHSWTPDVYQGSPIPVAAYLSVVSKTAGFAIIFRFLHLFSNHLELYSVIIAVFAVITMSAGNLMAIGQTNIRRLMAYSSIAQAGYILLGVCVLSSEGLSASVFYLITYLFMNFGVWAGIESYAISSGKDKIENYAGLAINNKYFALGLSICLLSLAGIPITAGFFSKFYLFKVVAFSGYYYFPLLIIALINTIIALYYYLRIIKVMYLKPEKEIPCAQNSSFILKSLIAICSAGVITLGIFSSNFIEFLSIINQDYSIK
jgi:NAD(P)H-quinone oxidoreductase subunit 2